MKFLRPLLLCLPLLLLGACDEEDAVSIRVRLRADAGGTLTTSGLRVSEAASPLEAEIQGAMFDSRVEVVAASGRFTQLSGLKVADITFVAGQTDDGFRYVKVTIPQGVQARWPEALMPLSEEARAAAAMALDPSGQTKEVGRTVKIEIELPANVIGNGTQGKVRGTQADVEGAVATLIVPIQASRAATESLVWHLTWQQ